MRIVIQTSQFRRNYKLMIRRGKNLDKINEIITLLATDEILPAVLRDHALSGDYEGFRECHIEPNWLLVYKKVDFETIELNELRLVATGTHSDLFG